MVDGARVGFELVSVGGLVLLLACWVVLMIVVVLLLGLVCLDCCCWICSDCLFCLFLCDLSFAWVCYLDVL